MRTFLAGILLGYCSMAAGQTISPEVRAFVKVDGPVIALTHVRVIDGKGSAAKEDQTMILNHGKINLWEMHRRRMCRKRRRYWISTDER